MNLNMKRLTVAMAAAGVMGLAGPAGAGSIFLTGHDNDFHENFGPGPGAGGAAGLATAAALAMVKGGSLLPVLSFDHGTELTNLLTAIGQSFVNVDPTAANLAGPAGAALFDHTKYSAFIVASVMTCGGCDNPVGTGTILATQELAIINFFNAGGGIIGLSGATDPAAYAYVPDSATNAGGSPPSTGYVQTADGALLGIPAVNGDSTHNFFSNPGTLGLSSAYVVTERLGSATQWHDHLPPWGRSEHLPYRHGTRAGHLDAAGPGAGRNGCSPSPLHAHDVVRGFDPIETGMPFGACRFLFATPHARRRPQQGHPRRTPPGPRGRSSA
jgi:hypothetical protein